MKFLEIWMLQYFHLWSDIMEPSSIMNYLLYAIPPLIYIDQQNVATMQYVDDRVDEMENSLKQQDDIVVNGFRRKFFKNFS